MPLNLRKPDRMRLALLALMLVVAYGGHTQSWAFSGKDMGVPPCLPVSAIVSEWRG
ncbi:MAG TPA: hypothetical protein VLE22_07270 [Bryobacteraceae bacterium]|jgi:hypothetical protein|nr:hypothetical protein [Bryobacteraceae bacterium]